MNNSFNYHRYYALRRYLRKITRGKKSSMTKPTTANDIRELGWSVAIHNDYSMNGSQYTFWLFTKDNYCIKGEGQTDEEALTKIMKQIIEKYTF